MRSLSRMWTAHTCALVIALHLTAVAGYDYGSINHDAEPYVIAMVNNASLGPDGPWWYIAQAVDFPDVYLPMLPSIAQFSLAVNDSACRSQTAACPLPLPNMWTESGAYKVSDGPLTQSDLVDATAWDPDYAALLDLKGYGRHYDDRMTLHRNSDYADPVFLDGHAMGISANFTVEYSDDAEYTMDAGFFSLNGAEDDFSWDTTNSTSWTANRTMFQAYRVGAIPSKSYGLQIGSVEPNVTSSLVLGGYDISRCLTDPIVSSSDTVQLVDVALNVSSGGYAYLDTTSAYIPGLLRANGSSVDSLPVHPRPGVPHLYLPKDTCDGIASHLPVTYSPEFNLYLWNTDQQAYHDIITSPHHLDFTFSSDSGQNSTISVPLALLNLTLTSPIVSSATQYFPCKPWTPDVAGYTLGSAFLQSAFIAQTWSTDANRLWLAQAPGPDFQSASVQKIGYTDTTLTAAKNPPSWVESWSSTLTALPANAAGNSSSPAGTSPKKSSAISGGAIAGIVIGAIAGLAIVAALIWFVLRKRRQGASQNPTSDIPSSPSPHYHPYEVGVPQLGKPAMAPHEVDAERAQVSEMWTGTEAAELPAKVPEKDEDKVAN